MQNQFAANRTCLSSVTDIIMRLVVTINAPSAHSINSITNAEDYKVATKSENLVLLQQIGTHFSTIISFLCSDAISKNKNALPQCKSYKATDAQCLVKISMRLLVMFLMNIYIYAPLQDYPGISNRCNKNYALYQAVELNI